MRCHLLITRGVWVGPADAVPYQDGWWIAVLSYEPPMRALRRAPANLRDTAAQPDLLARLIASLPGDPT